MPEIDRIEVRTVNWQPGRPARLWYGQPHLSLNGPPWVPQRDGPNATGFALLEATLNEETRFPAPTEAPSLILLPEYSLHPDEVEPARRLIARRARPKTIVVFGVGQMTEDQARAVEDNPHLWDGPSGGRLTNCAVIAFGGSNEVYLQPKIVRSRWEVELWQGRVVRYFVGEYVQFMVVICSDLLDRPQHSTAARHIVDTLQRRGWQLNLVIWIQHNPRPRSPEFIHSIESFATLRSSPTIVAVGSRGERSPRLNNFAVSGALLPNGALSSRFDLLTKPFHYVEPISPQHIRMSRAVLLRYDVDVYQVNTVLADSISSEDRVAKGALFEDSYPYVIQTGTLVRCGENVHIQDIICKATTQAVGGFAVLRDHIRLVAAQLASLRTKEFLAFLDLAILPNPRTDAELHVAGETHKDGDFLCRCWTHRECVDKLADEDESSEPLVHILMAIGALEQQGINVSFFYNDSDRRTYLRVRIGDGNRLLAAVYPFDFDAEGTDRRLMGKARPRILDCGYIVLGTAGRSGRLRIGALEAGVPSPRGSVRAGTAARPTLRAIYNEEFWKEFQAGTLEPRIRELFSN